MNSLLKHSGTFAKLYGIAEALMCGSGDIPQTNLVWLDCLPKEDLNLASILPTTHGDTSMLLDWPLKPEPLNGQIRRLGKDRKGDQS